jgi:hypothetical protein
MRATRVLPLTFSEGRYEIFFRRAIACSWKRGHASLESKEGALRKTASLLGKNWRKASRV